MRHRVRGKSLSCPHFHVLSFLSFGMERADRKRGEIAFARYRFEMTRRTLCSPPFIPFLAKRLLTFPSKKMNESVGIIETEDTRRVERETRTSWESSRKETGRKYRYRLRFFFFHV